MSDEPNILGAAPYLLVDDVSESAAYYRDVLGFELDHFLGDPPWFALVQRGSAQIMLQTVADRQGAGPNEKISKQTWDMYILTDDAKSLHEEFSRHGATFAREIEDADYGRREFDVRDNSGYVICFGQIL